MLLRQIQPVKVVPRLDVNDAGLPLVQLSCSFAEFQRFESTISECVKSGDKCDECLQLAQFVENFRKRPHLVRLSWNGASTINPMALGDFLSVVAAFAKRIEGGRSTQTDKHQRIVTAVAEFQAVYEVARS